MKIAVFTDTFLPQVNGVAMTVADFSLELGRRGHKVIIFCPKIPIKRGRKFKAPNVRVLPINSVSADAIYPEWRLALGGIFKTYRILKKFRPDIIHFHSPLTLGTNAYWLAKILKKPLVATCHMDLSGMEYLRWIKPIVKSQALFEVISSFFDVSLIKAVFKKSDLLIVPSNAIRQAFLNKGWKKMKIVVVPNGISERPKILPEKEKEKLKKNWNLGEKVVIYIGRLSADKNLEILVRAMKKVIKEEKKAFLFLIGDGPERKNLEKKAEKLGIKDNVIFSGYLSHEAIISGGVLSLADVFAIPSKMEVHSVAVIEAMACGLPIVAADAAGLSDVISGNGFLVPPDKPQALAEKVLLLLEDRKLREKMGQRSKAIFEEKYRIEKTTDKLEKVYRGLLKN